DLPAPLADLHDERDVRADRHVVEHEIAFGVGERGGGGVDGAGAAAIAGGARRDGGHRRVGHVHDDVVERHLAGRVVDGAAHGGARVARAGLVFVFARADGAGGLLALEVDARVAARFAGDESALDADEPASRTVREARAAAAGARGAPRLLG